ncbi:MAG: transcription antitermination factor NusB [Proteobacteria bacterium]|nr:transcription antitermination factor NusB [Pseudomonadota bacterium]
MAEPAAAAPARAGPRVSPRRRARELALQGLYALQLAQASPATVRQQLAEDPAFDKADGTFFDALWKGVTAEDAALVGGLAPHLDRAAAELSPIERSILVIGAWELEHRPETPYRVVINEAVELAKRYGGIDGHKFVNGVLDRHAASVRAAEVAARSRADPKGKPATRAR